MYKEEKKNTENNNRKDGESNKEKEGKKEEKKNKKEKEFVSKIVNSDFIGHSSEEN